MKVNKKYNLICDWLETIKEIHTPISMEITEPNLTLSLRYRPSLNGFIVGYEKVLGKKTVKFDSLSGNSGSGMTIDMVKEELKDIFDF